MEDTRTQIETIVTELLSKEWVTPSNQIALRSLATVDDGDLPSTLALLANLKGDLDALDAQYAAQEQKLMEQHLAEIMDIQHRAVKEMRTSKESINTTAEVEQQSALLTKLTQL